MRDSMFDLQVTWEEVECAYVQVQNNVHAFLQATSDREIRSCRIHYEDLLRQPERTLTKVCKLIGLEFANGMDMPYESEDAVASYTSSELINVQDPKL